MRKTKALPFVKVVKAKGRRYAYFDTGVRKADGKLIYKRLPPVGDPGFGDVYAALLAWRTRRANVAAQLTVERLIDLYERSAEFRALAASTRQTYSIYLARISAELRSPANGSAPAYLVERRDILTLRDKMALTPGAANGMLRTTRALYRWARDRQHLDIDPCKGITLFEADDYPPWPEELLDAALAADDASIRMPVALLYYTAQRIGDVCAIRWGDVRDGVLSVKQQKTGKELEIRLHRSLAAELAKHPRTALTILADERSRALRPDTVRERLQRFAKKFGYEVVPHGLRKNAVNAMLEAGCSAAETAAVTGQSLQMVEHYAKRRSTRKLAQSAILKFEGGKA
jgi:integrase